jgi:CopG family nickel-responsive transcriptional regulator
MPEKLLQQFDSMLEARHSTSRSQAISELIHQQVTEHRNDVGEETMAGTINLVYDHTVPDLQKTLAELQYKYLDEVISCLNVNLTHKQTMSVLLVQGPGKKLQQIADEIISRRGIITGKLLLSTSILPPVHPLSSDKQD